MCVVRESHTVIFTMMMTPFLNKNRKKAHKQTRSSCRHREAAAAAAAQVGRDDDGMFGGCV
jgi:hypothetical protein